MAAGFSVTISAVDTASKTIDNVNRRLASIRAPAERLQKSLTQFGKLSGVTQVAQGFEKMGGAALNAFRSVARVVSPLSAITGAASIAGMYRLVEAWDRWGSQLKFSSARIGVSVTALQGLEGAAQLAGASAGSLTGGLQSLGGVMNDAVGGRNAQAVGLFNQLGISFQDGARHALSVTQVMPKLADSIAKISDPFNQARVATVFFGGAAEDLLPFLRKGAAGIAEYTSIAASMGVTNQAGVEAADRLRTSQVKLSLAVQGLTNSVAERLAPILGPLLDQMSGWIAANRDWIATGIGEKVNEFAGYLKTLDFAGFVHDLEGFAGQANAFAQALGGWKTVLEGVVAINLVSWAGGAILPITSLLRLLALVPGSGVTAAGLAIVGIEVGAIKAADAAVGDVGTQGNVRDRHTGFGKWIYDSSSALRYADNWLHGSSPARMATPTSAETSARQKQALAYYTAHGRSLAEATGMVANMTRESALNPFAVGDNGAAMGLGQWHPDRQANFTKWAGHDLGHANFQEQLAFYDYEMRSGSEQAAGAKLSGVKDPFATGAIVSAYDERPANRESEENLRGSMSQALFNQYSAPGALDGPPVSLADGSRGAAGASGKVDVTIRTAGPGVQQVTAKSTGNVNPPKIAANGVGVGSGGT